MWQAFRDAVLKDFFTRCDEFLEKGFSMIRDEYLALSPFIGSDVKIRRGDEWVCGRACGMNA